MRFIAPVLVFVVAMLANQLRADSVEGPGGPILVVTADANPFSGFYSEILRTEGFNLFSVKEIGNLWQMDLAGYQVVILAARSVSERQLQDLTEWVEQGGQLIAMRPGPELTGLLGLRPVEGQLTEGYLKIHPDSGAGHGVARDTMQFHGVASLYSLDDATALATLYKNSTQASEYPAATVRAVGASGGHAASFAFDLATSIVLTRQGNPAWSGQERDGVPPIRANDLFFGNSDTDPRPDWVDPAKISIPQADEQQRFFANLIVELSRSKRPLPRFWYFPHGHRAVIVFTGDDHGVQRPERVLDQLEGLSAPGCYVADWECLRMTLYVFPHAKLDDSTAARYVAAGFEIAAHVDTGCRDFSQDSLADALRKDLRTFSEVYPSVPEPATGRFHCIVWSDWSTGAEHQLVHGIRFDTNYYYWPPAWVNDTPGHFTGSAMPMRFVGLRGRLIDVFQVVTQMTDESGQTYPATVETLLGRALGDEEHFGVYTVNAHTDGAFPAIHRDIARTALAYDVPAVTSRQLLGWLDARNASSFEELTWDGTLLTFKVAALPGTRGLMAILPYQSSAGVLVRLRHNDLDLPFQVATIKGIDYAMFPAGAGSYSAVYALDAAPKDIRPPSVVALAPVPGASGVEPGTALRAIFDKPLQAETVTDAAFSVIDERGAPLKILVSYDAETGAVDVRPRQALERGMTYLAVIKGGFKGPRVLDKSGNALPANLVWSFSARRSSFAHFFLGIFLVILLASLLTAGGRFFYRRDAVD